MDQGTLIIATLGVTVFAFAVLFKQIKDLRKEKNSDESQKILLEWLREMRSSLDKNTDTLQTQLQSTNRAINERLDNAARIIGSVSKEIGQMSEIGRSMKDLQEFLASPKLRGNLGEQVLKELLSQFLPRESFHLQYRFRSGESVDAAIKTESGIIPIDSKFPMENFQAMLKSASEGEKATSQKEFVRDVKRHIDDIAKKYILPEEGTIDYALMYVPSEAVYYDIMANNPSLSEYSHKRRVLPVSPSTFYAYMRSILMSFEGKKIEERAREILSSLRSIQGESEKFGENLKVLTKHITDAKNSSDVVNSRYLSLNSKINASSKFNLVSSLDEKEKPSKMESAISE